MPLTSRANFFADIERALSPERLGAYRVNPAESKEELLARYLWNVELSEALMPTLCHFEVALRNALNGAAEAHFANTHAGQSWFDIPGILESDSVDIVRRTKRKLRRNHRQATQGRVVAELTFGFWTMLLNKSYNHKLWPQLIPAVVPNAPNLFKNRRKLQNQIEPIRRLRNRAMHHEAIWNYQDSSGKSVDHIHRDAVDALGWISIANHHALVRIDRFDDVFQNGFVRAQNSVQAMLAPIPL